MRKNDEPLRVQGYYENDKEAPIWKQRLEGAGAIISSTSDLLVYRKAQLPNDNTELTESIALTQKVSFTEENTDIGLAWQILRNSKDKVIMHTGRSGGQSSFIAIDLDKSIVIVILANKSSRQQEAGLRLLNLLSRK